MFIFYYHFLGTQGQQIIMVSSAGGLKQISGATMSQAGLSQLSGGGPGGVKMVVVSSGQLAQAQNTKPITISMPGTGSQKTVTLSGNFKLESPKKKRPKKKRKTQSRIITFKLTGSYFPPNSRQI